MRTLPAEFRHRVVALTDDGFTTGEIAETLGTSAAWVQRAEWAVLQAGLDPRRLVFLDETFGTTKMTRRSGWGPKGERVIDRVPHGHGKTTPFVAAPPLDGLFAPLVVAGPLNGELFREYVRQQLAPRQRPGDVLVMDNLATHNVAGVAEAVAARGARVLDLRPYSPDLNPIEMVFSKVKTEHASGRSGTSASWRTPSASPSTGRRPRTRGTTSSTAATKQNEIESALIGPTRRSSRSSARAFSTRRRDAKSCCHRSPKCSTQSGRTP